MAPRYTLLLFSLLGLVAIQGVFGVPAACPLTCGGHGNCTFTNAVPICDCSAGFGGANCTEKGMDIILDKATGFIMTWVPFEKTAVDITLSINSACWMGIGLNGQNEMKGADFMIASTVNGVPKVWEAYSANVTKGEGQPLPYANQSSILWYRASVTASRSEFTFRRLLTPKNGATPITSAGNGIIWARCMNPGQANQATIQFHGKQGSSNLLDEVKFVTAAASAAQVFASASSLYAATGVMFGLVLALAAYGGLNPDVTRAMSPAAANKARFAAVGSLLSLPLLAFLSIAILAAVNQATLSATGLLPDTALFYTYIGALCLCFTLFHAGPFSSLHWLHTPLKMPLHMQRTCVGEVILVLLTLGFQYWFFQYWWLKYHFFTTFTARMGVVCGHMAEMNLALLFMPIARNSVWMQAFGIPFERALKYHRWLGYWMIVWVFGHGILYEYDWAAAGILHVCSLTIQCKYAPLWTAFTGEVLWALVSVLGITTIDRIRRRYFEMFFVPHHLYFFILAISLLHGYLALARGRLFSYIMPGLGVYIVDRLIRLYRSRVCQARVVSLAREFVQVTRLEVEMPQGFSFIGGQYAFVCIPAISSTQWHPFSISSTPLSADGLNGRKITFHIKRMGKGTWTNNLALLADVAPVRTLDADQLMDARPDVKILVDGPYGKPGLAAAEYEHLVLIGGGVGITPVASLVQELMQRAEQQSQGTAGGCKQLYQVVLVWIVREPFCLDWFSDLVARLREHPSGLFRVRLHVTMRQVKGVASGQNNPLAQRSTSRDVVRSRSKQRTVSGKTINAMAAPKTRAPGPRGAHSRHLTMEEQDLQQPADIQLPRFKIGRPNFGSIFRDVTSLAMDTSSTRVGVFCCGPSSLLNKIQAEMDLVNATSPVSLDMHSETFLF